MGPRACPLLGGLKGWIPSDTRFRMNSTTASWGWRGAYACETTARITVCSEGFVARIDLQREGSKSNQVIWALLHQTSRGKMAQNPIFLSRESLKTHEDNKERCP